MVQQVHQNQSKTGGRGAALVSYLIAWFGKRQASESIGIKASSTHVMQGCGASALGDVGTGCMQCVKAEQGAQRPGKESIREKVGQCNTA